MIKPLESIRHLALWVLVLLLRRWLPLSQRFYKLELCTESHCLAFRSGFAIPRQSHQPHHSINYFLTLQYSGYGQSSYRMNIVPIITDTIDHPKHLRIGFKRIFSRVRCCVILIHIKVVRYAGYAPTPQVWKTHLLLLQQYRGKSPKWRRRRDLHPHYDFSHILLHYSRFVAKADTAS
jgi:hypothetical protein